MVPYTYGPHFQLGVDIGVVIGLEVGTGLRAAIGVGLGIGFRLGIGLEVGWVWVKGDKKSPFKTRSAQYTSS